MPFQIDITFSHYYFIKYLVHCNFIVLKVALLWCIQCNNEKHTYALIGKVCDTQKLNNLLYLKQFISIYIYKIYLYLIY